MPNSKKVDTTPKLQNGLTLEEAKELLHCLFRIQVLTDKIAVSLNRKKEDINDNGVETRLDNIKFRTINFNAPFPSFVILSDIGFLKVIDDRHTKEDQVILAGTVAPGFGNERLRYQFNFNFKDDTLGHTKGAANGGP
jgi:hypothetical protein